ncbi:MAG: hypothetical protein J1E38_04140 [Paramuribaculum sp.]|nr:hypothetical protein [Paramuribaculum sp.]
MKKIILALALMIGGAGACTIQSYALSAPQKCDVNSPCLFDGKVRGYNGSSYTGYYLDIQVRYAQGSSRKVATFMWNGKQEARYCFYDDSKKQWYFNFENFSFYFSI